MMTATIAAIVVIGFLFSVGCGCGCCYCTSCSQTDDEAATYEVTITGVIDGSCCTGCSGVDGTYSLAFEGVGDSCIPLSPLSAAEEGCCYAYVGASTIPDCSACPDASASLPTQLLIYLRISSAQSETGANDCYKTLTTVIANSDPVAGWLPSHHYLANFQDLADPILDCTLASYNARDIPFTGAVAAGCNWWTTPATCTVTRT